MVTMDEKTVTKQENFVCGQEPVRLLVWLIIVRANLSFGEITLFPPRTCLRVILFDVAQYSLKNGMTHSHHVFILRVSGHFVPWSDRSKSDRSNQLSDRSTK